MGSARKGADGKAGFGSSKLSTVLVYASLVAVIVTASLGRRGRREIAIGVDRAQPWGFPLFFLLALVIIAVVA